MGRIFACLAACLAFSSVAVAAPQSPDAFLHAIYLHYGDSDKKGGEGILLDNASQMRRYFTDDLVAMVQADEEAANKRGDVPELDGDPFIDAQDWQVTNLKIHIDSQTATNATATVTFDNFKELKKVRLALVNTPKGWRISDVFWSDGSFRGLYKKK